VAQGVFGEGCFQRKLGKVVMISRDVTSFAAPAQEIQAERSAEVEVKRFQDLNLHFSNCVAGTRVVTDVDKIV